MRRGERGMSLIELMIAMTLSSFLIIGVTQMYLDGQMRYRYFSGQAQNQDNARFALQTLDNRLDRAGYRRLPSTRMTSAFPAQVSGDCSFAAGQALVRVNASTLCLRYQPRDPTDVDCAGNTLSGVAGLTNPYAVFNANNNVVERIALNGNNLVCNGTALVENVVDLRFDFGVDSATDEGRRRVVQYIATPTSAQTVRSVRYSLLLASPAGNLTGGMTSSACQDWKNLYGSATCSTDDSRLLRIATGSAMLRNLMP